MKNTILFSCVAILTSIGAAASAETGKTVAQVKSVDATIRSVQLLDNGVLNVIKQDGSEASMVLSRSNAEEMINQAEFISQTPLVTDHRAVICMMLMEPMFINNLYLAGGNGDLKLILSSSACSFANYTHPKDDYMITEAQKLETQLITLAKQLAND